MADTEARPRYVVALENLDPESGTVVAEVHASVADDWAELLDGENVRRASPVAFSVNPNTWIQVLYVLSGSGAAASFAAALRTLLTRHKDKEVMIFVNHEQVSLKGYSASDAQKIITKLEDGQAKQLEQQKRQNKKKGNH